MACQDTVMFSCRSRVLEDDAAANATKRGGYLLAGLCAAFWGHVAPDLLGWSAVVFLPNSKARGEHRDHPANAFLLHLHTCCVLDMPTPSLSFCTFPSTLSTVINTPFQWQIPDPSSNKNWVLYAFCLLTRSVLKISGGSPFSAKVMETPRSG